MMVEDTTKSYLCDPEKHSDCKKTSCGYNPDRIGGPCWVTKYPEFARTDGAGHPIRAVVIYAEECTEVDSELHPFRQRAPVDLAKLLATIGLSLAVVSLIVAATILLLL